MRTPFRGVRTVGDRSLTLVSNTPRTVGSLRLLCVDDEEDIRIILEMSLALDAGITAQVVGDAETMLQMAASGGYDAFLLDGMMPGMDGYEVCRRLKADPATSHVPVVFLTARTQREEVLEAQALGAVACLTKPFDPMTIAGELRTVLNNAPQAVASAS